MKKLILILLGIVPACVVSAQEHPKNIVGIRAGYAHSWVTSNGVRSSDHHGYMVGVSDEIRLSRKTPFYFETGLNFLAKGYAINGYDDSSTSFHYVQLPVGINYHICLGRQVTIEPAAGFYYAFGLAGRRTIGDEKVHVFTDGSTSRHDFGVACGLSTTIGRFHLGVSYETGLMNIDKADKVYGDDSPMLGYKKLKNNSMVLKLGLNF